VRESTAGASAATSGTVAVRADAFRRLADGQLEDSYRLASAILGDPTDARDAVHDAVLTAWQRWPSLRDPNSFEGWFKRIVVNTCRDRLRRASRRRTIDLDTLTIASTPDASGVVHAKIEIEQGLARLKPDDRIVLALRYYRDLKVEDIATLLDVPAGTVKSRLNHAHTRLRIAIEQAQPKEAAR
jgi:RNA polymerase sigma-70 factor (ECF subfamily)